MTSSIIEEDRFNQKEEDRLNNARLFKRSCSRKKTTFLEIKNKDISNNNKRNRNETEGTRFNRKEKKK